MQSIVKGLGFSLFTFALAFAPLSQAVAAGGAPVAHEPLPYAQNALEPHISSATLGFHHGKHHLAYVNAANDLLKGTPLAEKKVEEIIREAAGKPEQAGLFNNIAQAWNHAFFWKCLKANGGGKPGPKLAAMIDKEFGSFEKFTEAFITAGKQQFGSGWVWLVLDNGSLKIVKTPNAETPLTTGAKPIFVVDVWEHAYYLDYQNRRPDFVKTVLEHLADWEFVTKNLD